MISMSAGTFDEGLTSFATSLNKFLLQNLKYESDITTLYLMDPEAL